MNDFSDQKILDSWQKNVRPWAKAIKEKEIESRQLVTDKAIVNLIDSLTNNKNQTVLDIGCGEGWLVRALSSLGLAVTGIDAIEGLIDKAKEQQGGSYQVLKYEDISATALNKTFDLAVCNFSLIGKESVEHLFRVIPTLLKPGGYFIIQTLHPHVSCGDKPYLDGWREGSWQGFSQDFVDPSPWYFRTLESWSHLFINSDFKLEKIQEAVNPETGKTLSLLMVGKSEATT